jgi:hypothetical protein
LGAFFVIKNFKKYELGPHTKPRIKHTVAMIAIAAAMEQSNQ